MGIGKRNGNSVVEQESHKFFSNAEPERNARLNGVAQNLQNHTIRVGLWWGPNRESGTPLSVSKAGWRQRHKGRKGVKYRKCQEGEYEFAITNSQQNRGGQQETFE